MSDKSEAYIRFRGGLTMSGPVEDVKMIVHDHVSSRCAAGGSVVIVDCSYHLVEFLADLRKEFPANPIIDKGMESFFR